MEEQDVEPVGGGDVDRAGDGPERDAASVRRDGATCPDAPVAVGSGGIGGVVPSSPEGARLHDGAMYVHVHNNDV